MEKLNKIKRALGLIWMILGPLAIIALVVGAFQFVDPTSKSENAQPLPWIIMITIFTPVAIGLCIFGWYAWKGEYDGEIKT